MLNSVTDGFRAELKSKLPEAAFRELTESYLQEPRGRYHGGDGFLIAPDCTEDVATVVRACAEAGVGIIPYGGGTGLVGGQVAESGPVPVILSLERMNEIRDVFPTESVMTAEAGVILSSVQKAAEAVDRLFPLSLASEGSARIGGNLATNAGGVNVLRYGNARDLCLGVEAVLPDGSILNGLSRLKKNNTGYDLRHLLIGAEGTLGIITAASLKLFPKPAGEGAALMVVPDPQAALDLLALAGDLLGHQVSAFELINRMGLDFLAEVGPEVRAPFTDVPEWMVLIDVGCVAGLDPSEALERLFEAAAERELVSDGVIAQSGAQRDAFWTIRESIPEANRRIGSVSSHDISVPIGRIPEFIARGGQALARLDTFRINCFGHVGDGNLHYNVFPVAGKSRVDHDHQRGEVKRIVHDLVAELDGSISAEHGIGRLKVDDLNLYGDPTKLAAMRAIKAALDPKGIMNPGAVVSG
ncbi:FAD-binding oxidoreductase [Litoreibacter arenae]|uniref:D-2-hydroxyglutarate dehydrogenase n=1 Tax=Litoreibacter arenae DSM 19593 TaxID=1123360 RepID=S9S3G6_9RHOB|nr:FAD-binding oxidoreductase [Litoreibacter arenae]EPX80719.1 D-2-hydroxyglutarate dehydrogenase [Litoreibacter arenae DSM 19593]